MPKPQANPYNFAGDTVDHWARERGDGLALWCLAADSHTEHKLTWSQVAERSKRAASFFRDAGLKPGDRVLVILPRIPDWWIAMLGLIRLGAVPIPGTTLLTAKDIAYRAEAAAVSGIVTDAENAPKAVQLTGVKILAEGTREGWLDFKTGVRDASADFAPERPTLSTDPGLVYFTSGTTGPPKMVLHTQSSYAQGHRLTGEEWLDLHPDDVHWNMADNGWAKAAWSSLFGPWQMGACVFATDARGKFDPVSALQILSKYPITSWCAAPTALRLMVKQDLSAYRFPHLRHCTSAGEPLNPEVVEIWKTATGLTIYEGYGQTETVVLVANFRRRNLPVRPGSMGQAAPGYEVAILGDDLQPMPDDQEGEVAVRVKPERPLGLFQEYWKNPEENAAKFRGDWYLTGDRAKRDADGYFWFVGRDDDVINSAGYRIGPFEVESALIEHPSVMESAVVGKPDAMRGQIVKAYVVLRPGREPSEALKTELQEHCKRTTAPYKYPREIVFVSELPKTISGKIRRVELRKRDENG